MLFTQGRFTPNPVHLPGRPPRRRKSRTRSTTTGLASMRRPNLTDSPIVYVSVPGARTMGSRIDSRLESRSPAPVGQGNRSAAYLCPKTTKHPADLPHTAGPPRKPTPDSPASGGEIPVSDRDFTRSSSTGRSRSATPSSAQNERISVRFESWPDRFPHVETSSTAL